MSGASGNVRAGRAFVELMLDQTKLERGLKAAQAKLRNFGNSMTSVGKNLVTVATLAAAPLAYSTKTFADFDDEMRMVKAVTGATEQQFKSLTAVAEELGRTDRATISAPADYRVTLDGDQEGISIGTVIGTDKSVTITAVPYVSKDAKVNPVTFEGDATFSQQMNERTGVRTITIQELKSHVTVTFDGITL